MTELTKEYIDNLKKIIEEKDDVKARELLKDLYPADISVTETLENTQPPLIDLPVLFMTGADDVTASNGK